MWWYKLRKYLKNNLKNFITDVLGITLMLSAIYSFFIPLFTSIEKSERIQLYILTIISLIVNIPILFYFDGFDINILLKIILTIVATYFLYLPFVFSILLFLDVKDIQLDKDEKRDAILSKILNKF